METNSMETESKGTSGMNLGIISERFIPCDEKKTSKRNSTIDRAVEDCSVVMNVKASSQGAKYDGCSLTCEGDCSYFGNCTNGECMCYRD